jgi:hypothetical protein
MLLRFFGETFCGTVSELIAVTDPAFASEQISKPDTDPVISLEWLLIAQNDPAIASELTLKSTAVPAFAKDKKPGKQQSKKIR